MARRKYNHGHFLITSRTWWLHYILHTAEVTNMVVLDDSIASGSLQQAYTEMHLYSIAKPYHSKKDTTWLLCPFFPIFIVVSSQCLCFPWKYYSKPHFSFTNTTRWALNSHSNQGPLHIAFSSFLPAPERSCI